MTTDLSPEYATLGGRLLAPRTVAEVQRWLRPEDFAGLATRLTYSLILAMDAGTHLGAAALLALTARSVQQPDVVPVLNPEGGAYTTLDMPRVEQHALALATRRGHDHAAQLPSAEVIPSVVRSGLRSDQQRAVLHLLSRGALDRVMQRSQQQQLATHRLAEGRQR